MWTYIGAAVALFSFSYAGWIVAKTVAWGVVTPGFATLTCLILFLGGVQLIGIGVLGEYIGRIVTETKHRPLFLVDRLHGFEKASADRVGIISIEGTRTKKNSETHRLPV